MRGLESFMFVNREPLKVKSLFCAGMSRNRRNKMMLEEVRGNVSS